MRRACLLGLVLAAGLTSGCVDRRYTIYTDPPLAAVLVNNQPLGPSPADGGFVYYGDYNFTLIAPGFETLHVREHIAPPWYEVWPLDFFFENLWPFQIRDVHTFQYQLVPMQIPNTEQLSQRGETVRGQGSAIRPAAPPPEETSGAPPSQTPPTQMPREGEK
jgi:hypothetical protein